MAKQVIPAENIDQALDDIQYDYVEKFITLSGLTRVMADILREDMLVYMSESPSLTGADMAEKVNCTQEWVYKTRKDARYIAAKDRILDVWFRSQAGKVYKAIIQTAIDGKVGSQRLYMESVGKTSKRIESRNVNVNADIQGNTDHNVVDAIDKFLTMLGNRGWSLEMIADRWRLLKNQQAF